ncbi:MAG TPA: single-stranded-DNA-specific exonuclease RecJ [Anaerolineaceae bacterium]|nr:MAG: Single-stranded-DNA-specific exonuclease [Anaerolineae bacterium 49_20]HAE85474.1 single-stranded-DNA-specific exonuclease RecJ [Anaerolineaceae bacterium]
MEIINHTPVTKRWNIAAPIPPEIDQELADFPPLLRQLLYNRGVRDAETAQAFLSASAPEATDPFLIRDMTTAVRLLHAAITNGMPIAIYGDYDVDGVTATALLYELLQKLGVSPRIYIPNRFDEGYGLNLDAVEQLAREGIGLIITVDCGIRSVEEIALARRLGMQVILTDHHQPGEVLPPADAILNVHQPDDSYPFKDLVGVGMAYKLAAAYLTVYPQPGVNAEDWLDLVALGTVADMAPLAGENRALVRAGIQAMRKLSRQGLYSLAQVSSVNLEKLATVNIGFHLAPRLNAAGRLDSAMAAFRLLTAQDVLTAGELALQLDSQNSERQEITTYIQENVLQNIIQAKEQPPIVFDASPEYNEGVVGLAASRITEALYRPSIIGHRGEDVVVASCRSIPEFNITRALDACADLLVRYGGHSMAAGLTVANENLPELLRRLNSIATKHFQGLELAPVLKIDQEIALDSLPAAEIPRIFEMVSLLEPTGRGNPEALFCSRNLQVRKSYPVGKKQQHLKLILRAGLVDYEAIAFGQGHWNGQLPVMIDIAYTFEINKYQGRENLQLNIRDIKPSEGM